ncbi:MAG TPA: cyanophycinase [Thermoanaerobaculia bacterium]|jgi:cyanophycinase
MTRRRLTTLSLLCLAILSANPAAAVQRSLVIHGGGAGGAAALERFVALAGGPEARIVVVPTAAGQESYDGFDHLVMRRFRGLGAADVRVLHAATRSEADREAFAAGIDAASGIWFTGGRQWRLADTYLGTKAEEAMHRLLGRGGAIGGGSAGATVQGSYLVRGDTRGAHRTMGDHERGFGFLPGVAIDQHLLARNRHIDLLEVIRARPDLLGIGVDENTAIVVTGDRFEVVGEGYVAIYDPAIVLNGGHFYFLRSGDRFDLQRRVAYRAADGGELWIPEIRPPLELDRAERQHYEGFYTDGNVWLEIGEGRDLVVRTSDGDTTAIRPVTRAAFVDTYSGEKVTFVLRDDGCVAGVQWLAGGDRVELRKVD